MQHIGEYESPLGRMLMEGDDSGLIGLWFEGQKYYAKGLQPEHIEAPHPVLEQTRRWLDVYFNGGIPNFTPPLQLEGSPFQLEVWKLLRQIPYGEVVTYSDIAHRIAQQRELPFRSARAVGQAVGQNKISIIIPCHRVIGSNGKLTGYAGGVERKNWLLTLERTNSRA